MAIIKNYGLFWKRSEVNWGSPGQGNGGTLMGRLVSSRKSEPVDFREQSGIYILQDGFRVIYVGQSGSGDQKLFLRLKSHTKNHLAERWDRFSWFGIKSVLNTHKLSQSDSKTAERGKTSDILNQLEGVLINVTEPPLNRQGARFGKNVAQYIQHGKNEPKEWDEYI
ncbi:hypothetical protein AAC691_12930 [Nguyenibacter vanlangensis]|uniref:GIY-YIG domain-containing protein n=1 Tax=Nguyenibacter vanlangensis TaxID=1216886 RepID=A0ABZ3D0V2_9PROT